MSAGRVRQDEALAAAIAAGQTVGQAAKAAKVSERTVYTRLKDPDFQARVAALREQLVTRTVSRLSALGGRAASTLAKLLKDDVSPGIRCQAAAHILSHLARYRESEALATRVAALEKALAMKQAGGDQVPGSLSDEDKARRIEELLDQARQRRDESQNGDNHHGRNGDAS